MPFVTKTQVSNTRPFDTKTHASDTILFDTKTQASDTEPCAEREINIHRVRFLRESWSYKYIFSNDRENPTFV